VVVAQAVDRRPGFNANGVLLPGWTLDQLVSAVHQHTDSDVAERLNAVIAVKERGTKRITHADVEASTALIILGAVSDRVGINNWKLPDTSLVFCGVDFTAYQSMTTFKLIKKYYSWADAGEIAATRGCGSGRPSTSLTPPTAASWSPRWSASRTSPCRPTSPSPLPRARCPTCHHRQEA
jgi:hypothetical protein